MKKLEKNWKVIVGILFVLVVIAHLVFHEKMGDDIFFSNIPLSELFSWLGVRYETWSSRILIETTLVITLKLPVVVWAVINSFMLFLIAYSISYLFTKNGYKEKLISLGFIFLFPIFQLNEAGWYATTINYIWPFALGMFSLIPIKKILTNQDIRAWMYPIYSICLLFACSHEFMCAILFVFHSLFLIYCFVKKKKNKFLVLQWIFTVASLVFILTCPGNGARAVAEIATWYPEYAEFHFVHKFILGLLSTTSILLLDYRLPFFLFLFLLPYALRNTKNVGVKILSFVPLCIFAVFHVLPHFFPEFGVFVTQLSIYSTQGSYLNMHSFYLYLFLLMAFVLFGSIVVSLYFAFQEKGNDAKYLFPLIFLAGLTTRVLMGFSATVYASGQRTFLFLHFAFIICDIVLFLKEVPEKHYKYLLGSGFLVMALSLGCMLI